MTKRKHFTELIQYEVIPLDRIRYPDPDVQYPRQQADVAGDHLIDATCWTREGLLAVATCYPVLISRSTTSQGSRRSTNFVQRQGCNAGQKLARSHLMTTHHC